jgi:AAA+ superfamily predicted ATPase
MNAAHPREHPPAVLDDAYRGACQRWLARACAALRKEMRVATQQRQAIAAGLTEDEARLSVESGLAELETLQEAIATVEAEAEGADQTLPMARLRENAGLDALDAKILLLAVAPHVDVEIRDAIARFNDNLLANYVDVRLCLELLTTDAEARLAMRQRFGNEGRLVRAQLVHLGPTRDGGQDNLLGHEVVPAKRVVQLLLGEVGTRDGQLVVHALAHHLERPLLSIDGARLDEMGDERFRRALFGALDQARLTGALVVIEGVDKLLAKGSPRVLEIQEQLRAHRGVTVLTSRDSDALDANLDRFVVHRLLLETPDAGLRERIFALHLPDGVVFAEDARVAELAGTYQFPGALVRNAMQVAVNRALAEDPRNPSITYEMLRAACHGQIRASLDQYAVTRRVKLTLDDLILPAEAKEDIDELFTAARYRRHVLHNWGFDTKVTTGKGIVALFSGDPGTGKTLCATILANELDLQLYQISIPRVVSKWIGETEKNIEKIFQTARANHGILLFDEADSLFASRTKVDSSVDRYSNMATNMLLQEIEAFEGIVILTTNLERNIDKAFQRRIGFKIHFPFPEPEMRAKIWSTLVPAICPIDDDVDWDDLGDRFELSGGHIKNAMLRAAYQAAADEGGTLAMRHIEFAARQECKNAGKVFRARTDFFDGLG